MKQSRYHFVVALLVAMLTVVGCGPLNFGINTRAVTNDIGSRRQLPKANLMHLVDRVVG